MSEYTAGSLRELRLRAGLTQVELAKRSGISNVTIWLTEKGRSRPRELTWRSLLSALSLALDERQAREIKIMMPSEPPAPAPPKEPSPIFSGEVLTRDEFFSKLKPKMNQELGLFFNEALISTLIDNAEFFSRTKFYPGDFSTAVMVLGELLRAQKRLMSPGMVEDDEGDGEGLRGRRRILPGGYKKKWQKKR